MTDLDYIQLTLELAAQGSGLVSPNPLVGSVVVKDGAIIGRGHHRYDELKHAEVWALEEAGEAARGSTIYINLEPCSHQGNGKRTPPCVQAIIKAGVKRVVASMVDPNPQVDGRGFELLRAAGIEVEVGAQAEAARRLNEKYEKMVTTSWPFVHLKVACSLDGRIATRLGESKWITGDEARAASQALRHDYDAILVGINTALADNPLLTDRTGLPRRRPLLRAVLDANLRLPSESQLVRTAREWPLVVFTAESGERRERREQLTASGVEIQPVDLVDGRLNLRSVLPELARRQVTSVLIEGGAEASASFVEQRLVDKVTFFVAPKIIGGREAIAAIGGRGFEHLSDALELAELEVTPRGQDVEITGYPKPRA